jgi:ubiquinone/menaquinone biosynthesis C-methylase UbiE
MINKNLISNIEEDVYSEVVKLVSYSTSEYNKMDLIKKELIENIDKAFEDEELYNRFKIIGSTASRTNFRGKYDIDGIIIMSPFKKQNFRSGIRKIKDLEELIFQEECFVVEDKANARFHSFDVSIGCVNGLYFPENNLGADLSQHPEFSSRIISRDQIKSVMLTKSFFRNLGLYGKKIGGFAIEQLIAYYTSFDNLLTILSEERPIFVDFSGKYKGLISIMTVSYPYCGLDSLTKRITEEDFEHISEYAKKVKTNPRLLLEETRDLINKEFWRNRVKNLGDKEELSIPDVYLNRRENRLLRKKVDEKGNLRILDLGCSNGHSTISINKNKTNFVFCIDLNGEIVKYAKDLSDKNARSDIGFIIGEITNLPFKDESFDIIYAKRSITNLPSRDKQKKAFKEVARVTKKSGIFYVFDIFTEGYNHLNKIRNKFGLSKIDLPYHSLLLNEQNIKEFASEHFYLEGVEDSTTTYYALSRVFYPTIADVFKMTIKNDSFLNQIFSYLPNIGTLGVSKLYSFKKK